MQHNAQIIDGLAAAAKLRASLAVDIASASQKTGKRPGLEVIIVGEDPASQIYVRKKIAACEEVGIQSTKHILPAETTESELIELVEKLNGEDDIHGILVQLPLPDHIKSRHVLAAISPDKDVDGFHMMNAGRLVTHGGGLIPCTPLGCMMLIRSVHDKLEGLRATVIGRSQIVGRPMSHLLLRANCTVLTAHRHTKNLAEEIAASDIVVAAAGVPGLIKGEWIKPGATVIDVGISRIPAENGKTKIVGDVCFETAVKRAGAITPVPGGVGPMTVACLLHNTFTAFKNSLA